MLDSELLALVRSGPDPGWDANDVLAEVLMREQRSGAYPSMRDYEFRTTRTAGENRRAKLQAIEEGYFLLGRLMSCVSLMNEGSAPVDALDEPRPRRCAEAGRNPADAGTAAGLLPVHARALHARPEPRRVHRPDRRFRAHHLPPDPGRQPHGPRGQGPWGAWPSA